MSNKAKDEAKTVGDLRPAPYNPRTISDPKLAALDKAMQKFGDLSGIVFNRTTGQLVGGHQRVKNLPPDALVTITHSLPKPNEQGTIGSGHVEVNGERWLYREVIWDETTERAANVAANQHGGTWDETLLADLLTDLQAGGYDMDLAGFDEEELARVLAWKPETESGLLPGVDPDDVPELPKEPITKLGDLIVLGTHTLLCGDSTDANVWVRLMGGRLADMVWTDPPYGVGHAGGSKDPRSASYRSGDTIENDSLAPAALEGFLRSALFLAWARSADGAAWYVAAPAGPPQLHFAIVLTEMKLWRQLLTWMKDSFVFGRSDYHYRHELIFYGWKEGAAHTWNGGRKQDTIIDIPRPKRSTEHPTMKPVALVQRCIENSSNAADLVVDPFGGSGTTLIAAEASGRAAALIELSTAYCDVIVARWENATGQKAVRP